MAQSVLLECCVESGFTRQQALSIDHPSPLTTKNCFALATDDVMHFTTQGYWAAETRMRNLDRVMAARGVQKNVSKDITGVTDGTAIGIDLVQGYYFAPNTSSSISLR